MYTPKILDKWALEVVALVDQTTDENNNGNS